MDNSKRRANLRNVELAKQNKALREKNKELEDKCTALQIENIDLTNRTRRTEEELDRRRNSGTGLERLNRQLATLIETGRLTDRRTRTEEGRYTSPARRNREQYIYFFFMSNDEAHTTNEDGQTHRQRNDGPHMKTEMIENRNKEIRGRKHDWTRTRR